MQLPLAGLEVKLEGKANQKQRKKPAAKMENSVVDQALANSNKAKKLCERCKKQFFIPKSWAQRGSGRFCSVECRIEGLKIHGHANGKSTEYKTWRSMKSRCLNPKNPAYHNYGGRGIYVCPQWVNSFEVFLRDMGKKPTETHSIDRINNNGNYEPSNCRWATPLEQSSNLRTNRMVTHGGLTLTMAEMARRLGLRVDTLFQRLKRGTPVGQKLRITKRRLTCQNYVS